MEGMERQYDDTMHQLFIEETKIPRNEELILKMKKELRETALELSESSLGIPVIAGMKALLDNADQGIEFHYRKSL
jgi:hypothetical protein